MAVGSFASANGSGAVAIGSHQGSSPPYDSYITTAGFNSVAIGNYAVASNNHSIAIGPSASTNTSRNSIAIGAKAEVTKDSSIAIGLAQALHENSIAIGGTTLADNQFVLGRSTQTVYIPGNLVVDGSVAMGTGNPYNRIYLRGFRNGNAMFEFTGAEKLDGEEHDFDEYNDIPFSNGVYTSDRRLKNVGEKFAAGINELSKLEFFHYTFKKDEAKTPHVGVIAQDLQKVFPDAVTKGDDGFLRIRWEDMFYAAINAIKELNTKIIEIAQNLTKTDSKIEEQAKIIEAQQKNIEKQQEIIDNQQKTIEEQQKNINEINTQYSELVKQNKELIHRVERIEKKI